MLDKYERDALHIVMRGLNGRYNEVVNALVAGNCPDWGRYQHLTGKISGINEAIVLIEDLVKNIEKADNDHDTD